MRSFIAAYVLVMAVPAFGQVIEYNGDALPEERGWQRSSRLFPPDRWLDRGWLHFRCEQTVPSNCAGEDDFYRWDLEAFDGVPRFFGQWRLITDGPRSMIVAVAPASFVAGGRSGVSYHFTIARDQVRFLRDPYVPTVWADIKEGAPHTYRLELYGEHWYEWIIDDVVADAGVPKGPYPTEDSVISFGARASCHPSTTAFDYIRFGVPEEEPVDCDAIRDFDVRCRRGKIKPKLESSLEEGTELTVTNDGDHRTMRIKPSGKGKVKYKNQTGEHTILLLNCPAISQNVTCGE